MLGTIAGVVTAFKAGKIAEDEARSLLKEYGTGDDVIDNLLSIGIGMGVGVLAGDIVGNIVDDLFDW